VCGTEFEDAIVSFFVDASLTDKLVFWHPSICHIAYREHKTGGSG